MQSQTNIKGLPGFGKVTSVQQPSEMAKKHPQASPGYLKYPTYRTPLKSRIIPTNDSLAKEQNLDLLFCFWNQNSSVLCQEFVCVVDQTEPKVLEPHNHKDLFYHFFN